MINELFNMQISEEVLSGIRCILICFVAGTVVGFVTTVDQTFHSIKGMFVHIIGAGIASLALSSISRAIYENFSFQFGVALFAGWRGRILLDEHRFKFFDRIVEVFTFFSKKGK